jgi:hypothetical protein
MAVHDVSQLRQSFPDLSWVISAPRHGFGRRRTSGDQPNELKRQIVGNQKCLEVLEDAAWTLHRGIRFELEARVRHRRNRRQIGEFQHAGHDGFVARDDSTQLFRNGAPCRNTEVSAREVAEGTPGASRLRDLRCNTVAHRVEGFRRGVQHHRRCACLHVPLRTPAQRHTGAIRGARSVCSQRADALRHVRATLDVVHGRVLAPPGMDKRRQRR